ncbi:hypothetical protein E4K72_06955, partial [Oxalobacteraceae bacterium OM1]
MKSFEHFLGQMMEAARLAQAKDPHAATGVIQKALRDSGLLPAQVSKGTAAKETAAAQADLIDVNPVPEWVEAFRHGDGAVPKGGRRARWTVPGRKRSGIPARDPRAPGEFLQGSFSTAAGTRRYKLYVPSAPASGPRPLIVMLHGCTQDPDD